VLIGMCPESEVALPLARIQNREVWVTGTFRYAHTYPVAIALISSGSIDLESLVDARFTLQASEDALLAAKRDPAVLRPLVRVSEN
jgi:L-iditol 2-dehydrogenase